MGVGYSSLNTARGALSALGVMLDGVAAGSHPLVIRFLKGVFNLRPPKPRYTKTWDVQPVVNFLRSLCPLVTLSLKELTLKLVMLMALTQAARIQTLHLLMLTGINIEDLSITLQLGGNIKQCRQNSNIQFVTFFAFDKDARLCVCKTLREYINRTNNIRIFPNAEKRLIISFVKPHKPVSKDTISRWVKTVLYLAGIDTNVFTAGSVRTAAASKAKALSVPISTIMAKAGWSRESNFARFYNKDIVGISDPFQDAVLNVDY